MPTACYLILAAKRVCNFKVQIRILYATLDDMHTVFMEYIISEATGYENHLPSFRIFYLKH